MPNAKRSTNRVRGGSKLEFARALRRGQTDVERKLWQALRNRRFLEFKFRRQVPIGPYIVDFASFEARLIIELDGSQHNEAGAEAYDAERTKRLEKDGFRVKRYWNSDVAGDFDNVLNDIAATLGVTP